MLPAHPSPGDIWQHLETLGGLLETNSGSMPDTMLNILQLAGEPGTKIIQPQVAVVLRFEAPGIRPEIFICQQIPLPSCLPEISFFLHFFLPSFLLHLQHMEVPRLGVELELQLLAYTTTKATWNLSHICDLHEAVPDSYPTEQVQGSNPHPHGLCWVLNLLSYHGNSSRDAFLKYRKQFFCLTPSGMPHWPQACPNGMNTESGDRNKGNFSYVKEPQFWKKSPESQTIMPRGEEGPLEVGEPSLELNNSLCFCFFLSRPIPEVILIFVPSHFWRRSVRRLNCTYTTSPFLTTGRREHLWLSVFS